MTKPLCLVALVAACAGAPSTSEPAAPRAAPIPAELAPPLWGSLSSGPHAVGFRTLYHVDRTRTWRTTGGYDRPFAPDTGGRPIRISLWYPALRDTRSRQLRFADYVQPEGNPDFAELDHVLAIREQIYAADRAPPGRWADLLATPVAAHADAPAVDARFPLVLFAGALGDTSTTAVSVAAEYLASHGYAVATVPILGPTSDDTEQGRTPGDRERVVRDLEVAWSIVRDHGNVDGARTGIFGHSLGGIEAVVFAMRNANVSAVAGLDGTYGFRGLGTLMTELPGYSPRGLRAAFLDLRRPDGNHGGVHDLTTAHAFHHADRTFITLGGMRHRDFRAYAMASFALAKTPEGEPPYRGYQIVCRILLDFFDAKLKGDRSAQQRLATDVASADLGTLLHEDAMPPPPSPDELAARGFDAATAVIDRYRRDVPDEPVVDEQRFTDRSAQLLADHQLPQAIVLRRLIVYTHPDSATAESGLAEAYSAAGDHKLAREAWQRALELIPGDASLTDDQKRATAQRAKDELAQLPR